METEFENASYPSHEEVEARAYSLWETDGRQPGRDWEYWLRAETELRNATRSDRMAKGTQSALTAAPGKQLQAPIVSENPRLNPAASGTKTPSFSPPKKRATTPKSPAEEKTTPKRRRGE